MQIWLQLMVIMLGTSIVKSIFYNQIIWVICDIAALAVCYIVLKRTFFINLRKSMLYISCFTFANILVDLGLIDSLLVHLIFLLLLLWLIYKSGGGNKRSPVLHHKWLK